MKSASGPETTSAQSSLLVSPLIGLARAMKFMRLVARLPLKQIKVFKDNHLFYLEVVPNSNIQDSYPDSL